MRKALMLASAGLIVLAGCSPATDKAEEYSTEAAPAADAATEAPAEAASTEYSSALSLAGEHPANTISPAEASIRALRIVSLPVP